MGNFMHFVEHALDSLGRFLAQVTFTDFGSHQLAPAGQPEPFGR
jgi:hypothetical protein